MLGLATQPCIMKKPCNEASLQGGASGVVPNLSKRSPRRVCGSATHAVLNPQNRVRAYGSHHQCSLKKPPAPTADGFSSFQAASFSAITPHPTSRTNPTSFHARNHSRNTSNGISCEPNRAKCAVSCWQSIRRMPQRARNGTAQAKAILEASARWANMDSP